MALKSALVLDDDAPFRRLLREALLTEGWSVRCAARDEAALHIAALRRPDVVMLDVSKPEFAPEAVAAGLRIHYGPQLPILATSTIPQPAIITRIGAFGFLQKPFEIDRLLSLLESLESRPQEEWDAMPEEQHARHLSVMQEFQKNREAVELPRPVGPGRHASHPNRAPRQQPATPVSRRNATGTATAGFVMVLAIASMGAFMWTLMAP